MAHVQSGLGAADGQGEALEALLDQLDELHARFAQPTLSATSGAGSIPGSGYPAAGGCNECDSLVDGVEGAYQLIDLQAKCNPSGSLRCSAGMVSDEGQHGHVPDERPAATSLSEGHQLSTHHPGMPIQDHPWGGPVPDPSTKIAGAVSANPSSQRTDSPWDESSTAASNDLAEESPEELERQSADHEKAARLLERAAAQQEGLMAVMQSDDAKEGMRLGVEEQREQAVKHRQIAEEKRKLALELHRGSRADRSSAGTTLDMNTARSYVRAVLRRDANGLFRLGLKEDSGGVYIAALPESEVEDERELLRVGDYIRALDGQAVVLWKLDEAKEYVRTTALPLTVEVFRYAQAPTHGASGPSGSVNPKDALDQIGKELQKKGAELQAEWQALLPRLQRLGEKAGTQLSSQWKELVDSSRDTIEERKHSLKDLKEELGEKIERGKHDLAQKLSQLSTVVAEEVKRRTADDSADPNESRPANSASATVPEPHAVSTASSIGLPVVQPPRPLCANWTDGPDASWTPGHACIPTPLAACVAQAPTTGTAPPRFLATAVPAMQASNEQMHPGSNNRAADTRATSPLNSLAAQEPAQQDDFATALTQLREMGFLDISANRTALEATGGNMERAIDLLMS
eukprot:663374-Pleurochrysis_carterae.AAC.5